MNRLEYKFDCLDGHYFLIAQWDEVLNYEIDTDIAEFESRSGELSAEGTKKFADLLDQAKIESWEKEYLPENEGIEDAVKWKLVLCKDEKEYVSYGEESFEPYGYELFVDALRIFEEKADYFLAKGE
ncbi:MAG: hypothetical protein IKS54_08420 [Erysipelotrichaceae bacterium]|nr:hypothetical protein [Erysipelotrichaceae bacterium]